MAAAMCGGQSTMLDYTLGPVVAGRLGRLHRREQSRLRRTANGQRLF